MSLSQVGRAVLFFVAENFQQAALKMQSEDFE